MAVASQPRQVGNGAEYRSSFSFVKPLPNAQQGRGNPSFNPIVTNVVVYCQVLCRINFEVAEHASLISGYMRIIHLIETLKRLFFLSRTGNQKSALGLFYLADYPTHVDDAPQPPSTPRLQVTFNCLPPRYSMLRHCH